MDDAAITPKGIKVLCIEDEHFISELYARALTKAGYEVHVAVDGVEGLAEAETDKYDIILLDLMIPNMTGIEILSRLRGSEASTLIHGKIIITTNLEQGEHGRDEIEKLADGYIVKAEMTPRQLVEFLNQLSVEPKK